MQYVYKQVYEPKGTLWNITFNIYFIQGISCNILVELYSVW